MSSEITQASGLALDENGSSLWTHNDQGNPTTKLYKILTSTGETTITIQKQVNINNVVNLDWEDLARDNAGHVYICQIGKNCNDNSDPLECPGRYIYKIHKLSLASLNHPDSLSVTPEMYYFRYPLTGYDANNCSVNDTVFVNCEAAIWFSGSLYFFTKAIWSKPTNNCGGWQEGYTYMFKLSLSGGSSMQNPIVAEYKSKVNLKMAPSELAAKYNVTAAAISPDQTILSLTTYGRIWQFRNFTGDMFFAGTSLYCDYSGNGSDTITRGYEGLEFINNQDVILCVDGINGRLSQIDLDSLALWVRNKNDSGPGSVRNSLICATAGDTIHFRPNLFNDTIQLSSGPLTFNRNVNIIQSQGQSVFIKAYTSNAITVPVGKNTSLKYINIICGNAIDGGIINEGSISLENINLYNNFPATRCLYNHGSLTLKGFTHLIE